MKKYFRFITVFLVLLLLSSTCFAASPVSKGDATMKLVEDNQSTMTFGQYGEFEKKKVQIDTTNKTIDISLTARNKQEPVVEGPGEVVLLVDASNSMSTNKVQVTTDNGQQELSRKELVLQAADALIDRLLSSERDIKVGVVEFATSTTVENEGTDEDAKIVTQSLTNDKETLTSAINQVRQDVLGPRTDVEIGLDTAKELLDTSDNEEASKYIVVLTDAVPNTARGVTIDLYTEKSADPTKAKLTSLKQEGINVISMLIDISNSDIKITSRPEDATFKTYKDVANYVFGTETNPVAGPVYYINDDEVIDTVKNQIYEDLVRPNPYALTDIVIKDYFPQEIIDNFDFAYLTKPEIGEVSAEVDKSDNSITWTIKELQPGEEATFTYRLSLKNTFSSEIVDKNLPTNKNVTIDYKENDEPKDPVQDDRCPVVSITVPSPKEPTPETPPENPNTAPKDIPQTGSNTSLISGILISISAIIAIVSYINLKKNSIK